MRTTILHVAIPEGMDEVIDGVYRIDVPRPVQSPWKIDTDEPVSCHVRVGEDVLLFGAGYGYTADTVADGLAELGGLDAVFVEHAHSDHYGGVPTLLERFDDPAVVMPGVEAPVLQKVYNGVTADVETEHGEVNMGMRAIEVPGHTPANTAFLDESRGLLFAGDAVVHSDSEIAAEGDWSGAFAPIHPLYSARDELAREYLWRLAEYDFEATFLTHGENVLTDAKSELETLLDELDT